MRRSIAIISSILILFPLSPALLAQTRGDLISFYVAEDGDDATGDGSQKAPWATIGFALNSVADGSIIYVMPGTYNGRVRLQGQFAQGVTVTSFVSYQAKLRHTETVVTCFDGIGITLEGFDIAHTDNGSNGPLVIQIQDLIGEPGGDTAVSNITIRNNIIHDSYNNDLLKINNGARDILVENNIFFNQSGSDEHIDINGVENITVSGNIFFNDFEGSGRINPADTSSFIVIKNSAGLPVNQGFTISGNIFLHYQGSSGTNFLLLGEDGNAFYEAENVLIENNLFLGDGTDVMRAAFGVKGGRNITFRHNTISGDLPSSAFAMRINQEGSNPVNDDIHFYNNIWSDPTGSMGAATANGTDDFSDTPQGELNTFSLHNNLYWNGGQPIPEDANETINPSDDAAGLTGNPGHNGASGIQLPHPNENGIFPSGSDSIGQEFQRLARTYGTPDGQSLAVDNADPSFSPGTDILGVPRNDGSPDIGALEYQLCDGTTIEDLIDLWPDRTLLEMVTAMLCNQ